MTTVNSVNKNNDYVDISGRNHKILTINWIFSPKISKMAKTV